MSWIIFYCVAVTDGDRKNNNKSKIYFKFKTKTFKPTVPFRKHRCRRHSRCQKAAHACAPRKRQPRVPRSPPWPTFQQMCEINHMTVLCDFACDCGVEWAKKFLPHSGYRVAVPHNLKVRRPPDEKQVFYIYCVSVCVYIFWITIPGLYKWESVYWGGTWQFCSFLILSIVFWFYPTIFSSPLSPPDVLMDNFHSQSSRCWLFFVINQFGFPCFQNRNNNPIESENPQQWPTPTRWAMEPLLCSPPFPASSVSRSPGCDVIFQVFYSFCLVEWVWAGRRRPQMHK